MFCRSNPVASPWRTMNYFKLFSFGEQLTHVQQLYDGASLQRDVTPLEERTSLPSYRKRTNDSPIRSLLVGLWKFLFCHQPASKGCLANVTTNLSVFSEGGAGEWCCGQDKAKLNKDENEHVSRKGIGWEYWNPLTSLLLFGFWHQPDTSRLSTTRRWE